MARQETQSFACSVTILVQSRDEYPPLFAQEVFVFNVPANAVPGFLLGTLRAHDADQGPDGFITFSMAPLSSYFELYYKSGALSIRRPLDTGVIPGELF